MIYIDNVDFAKKQQETSGKVHAANLIRASEIFDNLDGELDYTLSGSADNKNKPILKIRICGRITTLCQNCLEKLDIPIDYSGIVPIFYTEADMDIGLFGEDAEYEDGILADAHFDINSFIEDELIMILPIAPKHETCEEMAYHDKPDSPFRVLVN